MKDKLATVFNNKFTAFAPSPDWDSERTAKWAKERAFYNGTADYNVLDYLFNKKKIAYPSEDQLREDAMRRLNMHDVPNKSQARSISDYMTRFNTVGAFNLGGVMTKKEFDEFNRNIRDTGSNIWHGYLSIPPPLSVNAAPDDMIRLCRQTFGKFLRDAKLDPENIALMCVVHGDTDHAHFHYVFYEKQPTHLDKYGRAQFRQRGKIDKTAIENYRLSTTAYIDEHKEDFFSYRDIVMRLLRMSAIAPSDAELYNALRELSVKLPKKGRLQYNAEQIKPYRGDIDRIATMLLKRNPKAYAQNKKALREIARRGKELAELKAGNDNYVRTMNAEYNSRLGNVVLKLIKQLRFDPANRKTRIGKAAARRRRAMNKRIIDGVIKTLDLYEFNMRTDFTAELHRAERDIDAEKHKRSDV